MDTVPEDFLSRICCPENHSPLRNASESELAELNAAIGAGTVVNDGGDTVTEACDGALIREDGAFAYPTRRGIPILIVDERIRLATNA